MSAFASRDVGLALAHDEVLALDVVAHRDDALRDLRGRRIAAVGHQPLRAADRRRAVAPLRAEVALPVTPELARLLLRGSARGLLGLRTAQRLGQRERRPRLGALRLADLEQPVEEVGGPALPGRDQRDLALAGVDGRPDRQA